MWDTHKWVNSLVVNRELQASLSLAHNLIVRAIKIGATDLELNLPSLIYPREVLESKSIVRLSLARGEIDGNFEPCCPWLKSLSIDRVVMKRDDVFWNIITSCCASIEELSLSNFNRSWMYPYELHKLRRLFLETTHFDNTFFSDFATKFPCLKDLSLVQCTGYTRIEMTSTSLERIMLVQLNKGLVAKFDIPNIRKFTYSGYGCLPSLSIKASSTREWDFYFSIQCFGVYAACWFLGLKRLLKKMSLLSRITLSLNHYSFGRSKYDEIDNNIQVVPKRVVVENLTIQAPSEFCTALLVRLFGICCPKFITHYWLPESSSLHFDWQIYLESLVMLCNVLSANQNTFGLKEVKMEVYEEIHTDEWRPLVLKGPLDASKPPVNKCKVWFCLTWGL